MFSSEKNKLDRALNNVQTQFYTFTSSIFNRLLNNNNNNNDLALSSEEIKKRMAGVPVYEVSNYKQHRLSVKWDEDKFVQLYFFNKQDAEDMLPQFDSISDNDDQFIILDAPLTDVIDAEGNERPIRLVPEKSQVINALEGRKKNSITSAGFADQISYTGVPVFQSNKLVLKVQEKPNEKTTAYRLAFLRKEDLEMWLARTKSEHEDVDTSTIQVAGLEDIIQEMKDSRTSKSNDIVFVAPGIVSWNWMPDCILA